MQPCLGFKKFPEKFGPYPSIIISQKISKKNANNGQKIWNSYYSMTIEKNNV